MKHLLTLALVLGLGACGNDSPVTAQQEAVTPPPPIAPAIVPPEEVADPAEPPSYEVAIASAAAEHNKAKERCGKQPESVRAQCEQEANASFGESTEDLSRLRGNQP